MNKNFYDSLTSIQKEIVNDAVYIAVLFQRKTAAEEYNKNLQVLKDNGLSIVDLTSEQRESFRRLIGPSVELIRKEFGTELVNELLNLTR
jgi:TRAP-type C4-dicarboxylate transport system substrate-binding protein